MKTKLPKTISNHESPSLRTVIHGKNVKADVEYGRMLCRQVVEEVKLLTEVEGETEHRFHENHGPFDAAWPDHGVALEIQGWEYHHRRKDFARWFRKHTAATLKGWRVLYASANQAKKHGAIWVAQMVKRGGK